MLDFPEMPRGFRRQERGLYVPRHSRSLLRGDMASLVLNRVLFGADQNIDEAIQEEAAIEEICDSVAEYPFETPPTEDIYGPINIGYAEETGDPVGFTCTRYTSFAQQQQEVVRQQC